MDKSSFAGICIGGSADTLASFIVQEGAGSGAMGRERDEETGKFEEEFSDEDFVEALSGREGGVSTSEVAEAVGCAYRTAHARLNDLETEGVVTSRRVANALLWELDANETDTDE